MHKGGSSAKYIEWIVEGNFPHLLSDAQQAWVAHRPSTQAIRGPTNDTQSALLAACTSRGKPPCTKVHGAINAAKREIPKIIFFQGVS